MRAPSVRLILCLGSSLLLPFQAPAQEREGPTENPDLPRYIQPPPEIARILQSDKNYATLDYMSPDGDHFLVTHETELSTLDLMSRPTYRLAELELRPATDRLWHLDTYGIDGFRFYSLLDREFTDVDLPDGSFASDFTWSPDGSRVAFIAHLPSHSEIWVAEAASGEARSLSSRRVLATVATSANGQGSRASNMVQWASGDRILTLMVPSARGPEPAEDPIPQGPITRATRDEATSTRTYPNLLEDPHDETLFEHYTTSQLVGLSVDGDVEELGDPAMYESISASPDGQHVLAVRIERPFSYITSHRGFPRATVVLDREGNVASEVAFRPLTEGGGGFGQGGGDGPRDFAWRPDGSGLGYLERAERDEDEPEADRPDRLMNVTAPFDLDNAQVVAESEDPISEVWYSLNGRHALAGVRDGEKEGLAYWDLDDSS
ncbi:MAG: hypothetical protein HKO53_11960, partial [Gemmatimonadetes bacterium]|nr:hypothetical protein [Gemmatimonadota bacterium]